MIFDTHAHYDDEAFDSDRESLLESLPAAGIGTVVNIASSPESIEACLTLAHKYEHVYCALGIHPEHCADMTEEMLEEIRVKLQDGKAVAVGEIGLDYYWPEPDPEIQRHAADTMKIMKDNHAQRCGGVVHCYSYSAEMAAEFVKMGFYIGVGGVVTFKNARKLVEVARKIPLERLLLETDCPYLAPVPYRGKRNCSLYLPYVVAKIAELKGISEEEVIRVTEQNAKNMYRI